MDSKIVTREIRKVIWPVLREAGFGRFTGRTAWRSSVRKIDVVNFQSFNSYLAEGIGCTTFSFSLNLGCFLTMFRLGGDGPAPDSGAPQEYECHFRRRLQRTIAQPELERTDTWFIGTEGKYLAESVADARIQIQTLGLEWFERFNDDAEVIRTLVQDDEGDTWGFGAKESPNRHFLQGCAQLELQNLQAAHEHFRSALAKLQKSQLGFESKLEIRISKLLDDLKLPTYLQAATTPPLPNHSDDSSGPAGT